VADSGAPSSALTFEELRRLDAEYRSFPSFEEWSRTPIDSGEWDRHIDRLDHAKRERSQEEISRAQETILRAAAFDTGAVEGLYQTDRGITFTVAERGDRWEDLVDARNPGGLARALFDAQLSVYESLARPSAPEEPVTEAFIRAIHAELCRPQRTYTALTLQGRQEQELPKGTYKDHPNHVRLDDGSVFVYAPVDRTATEVARLVQELSSPAFASAHPVLQASYAHYGLVVVHPFVDGNGRVARAMASLYLLRSIGLPFVLFADDRNAYLTTLETANSGDHSGFVNFVRGRTEQAELVLVDLLAAPEATEIDDGLIALGSMLDGPAGLSQEDLDASATDVCEELVTTLRTEIGERSLPPGLSLRAMRAINLPRAAFTNGYRPLLGAEPPSVQLSAEIRSPVEIGLHRGVFPEIAVDRGNPYAIRLIDNSGTRGLDIRISDLRPSIAPAMAFRLQLYAQRLIGDLLSDLRERAEIAVQDHRR